MNTNQSRTDPYPLLVDALRLLPGIRPVYERHRLGEAKHCAAHAPDRTAQVNGVSVTLPELEQLFVWGKHGGGPRVSPAGAALLIRLFEQEGFEVGEPRSVPGGLELLTQYAKGLATLVDTTISRRPRRKVPRSPTRAQPAAKLRATSVEEPVVSARTPWTNAVMHRLV
jgi:hypothetical protein